MSNNRIWKARPFSFSMFFCKKKSAVFVAKMGMQSAEGIWKRRQWCCLQMFLGHVWSGKLQWWCTDHLQLIPFWHFWTKARMIDGIHGLIEFRYTYIKYSVYIYTSIYIYVCVCFRLHITDGLRLHLLYAVLWGCCLKCVRLTSFPFWGMPLRSSILIALDPSRSRRVSCWTLRSSLGMANHWHEKEKWGKMWKLGIRNCWSCLDSY